MASTIVKMSGVQFVGNRGVGMLVHGDGFDIHMVDTLFAANWRDGLVIKSSAALLIEKLSLPADIDRHELARLLSSLSHIAETSRPAHAASSSFLSKLALQGLNVSTLAANLATLSAHPAIQGVLDSLTA